MNRFIKTLLSKMYSRTVLLHILCWGIFILYECCFLYYSLHDFRAGTYFRFLIYYAVNICIFYSHLHLLDLALHQGKGYLKCIILFFLQFSFFILVKAVLDIVLAPPIATFTAALTIVKTYLFLNIFRGIYFCAFATFYWVAGNIAGYRKKAALSEKNELIVLKDKAEVEQRLADTRNAYLQQQLNPHLLFNSLSFIHSSVYAHSADAARCVLLLSDIMRFSMESTGSDGKALLSDELEQVANLITLNRYRFGGELCLQTSFDVQNKTLRIIPLILLILTENLFKHGFVTDPASPALLDIHAGSAGPLTYLTYHSFNRKKIKSRTPQRGGLGLQHTRVRLDHSYPGAYSLNFLEDEVNFELTLTIQL